MPKKLLEETQEEHSRRFEQMARELNCDETGEAFEKAFGKIVPPVKPKSVERPERKKPGKAPGL